MTRSRPTASASATCSARAAAARSSGVTIDASAARAAAVSRVHARPPPSRAAPGRASSRPRDRGSTASARRRATAIASARAARRCALPPAYAATRCAASAPMPTRRFALIARRTNGSFVTLPSSAAASAGRAPSMPPSSLIARAASVTMYSSWSARKRATLGSFIRRSATTAAMRTARFGLVARAPRSCSAGRCAKARARPRAGGRRPRRCSPPTSRRSAGRPDDTRSRPSASAAKKRTRGDASLQQRHDAPRAAP